MLRINHQIDEIQSEEQKPLEEFFEAKGLKTRNEMTEDVKHCSITTSRKLLIF